MINKKTLLVFTLVTVLVMSTTPSFVSAASTENIDVIIGFNGKPDMTLITAFGGEVKDELTVINAVATTLPEMAIVALRHNPQVRYVEYDGIVTMLGEVLPWGVDRIDADLAWEASTGTGVKVAVIDTGIDKDHPDLMANIEGGVNFVGRKVNPDKWDDDNGHGTHCAGIIAAVDNEEGVIGVAKETGLYGVKVLDRRGGGYLSDVVAGIEWSIDNNMDVISMSLGTSSDYQSMHDACLAAWNAGIVVVAAAGNEGDGDISTDEYSYPAAYDSVIAVAATDGSDDVSYSSNSGSYVELAAPGVSIYSTYKDGNYATGSGTSMACPHVSGTAALVISSDSILTNDEVRTRLTETAEDLGDEGKDNLYGYGLVDAEDAVGAEPDTTPPIISKVGATDITSSSATITWTTDEASDSVVNYGTTTVLGSTASDTAMVTSHSVTLTGLSAETAYHFEVQSTDASENTATDNNGGAYYTFTTTAAPSNVMHVHSIDMEYTTVGRNYKIYTMVKIVDSNDLAVEGATVYLEMTLPSGSTASGSGSTGVDGTVTFLYGPTKVTGTYISTVTDVVASGWTYDPTANLEMSESLVVP